MVGGDERRIVRPTVKGRPVEMVERRDRQQKAGPGRVHPGEVDERIALALDVPDAGGLLLGRVRDLVMVAAERRHQAELV